MKITYMGTVGTRSLTVKDLRSSGLDLEADDDTETYSWGPGETISVPDVVGEYLSEAMREQFKRTDETTRDLRSKKELLELAQEYQIPGRTTMTRDELQLAVEQCELDEVDQNDVEDA